MNLTVLISKSVALEKRSLLLITSQRLRDGEGTSIAAIGIDKGSKRAKTFVGCNAIMPDLQDLIMCLTTDIFATR